MLDDILNVNVFFLLNTLQMDTVKSEKDNVAEQQAHEVWWK